MRRPITSSYAELSPDFARRRELWRQSLLGEDEREGLMLIQRGERRVAFQVPLVRRASVLRWQSLSLNQLGDVLLEVQSRGELQLVHGLLCLEHARGDRVHLAGDKSRLLAVDGQLAQRTDLVLQALDFQLYQLTI